MRVFSLCVALALALVAGGVSAQTLGFEFTPGNLGANPEGWTSDGGTATVVPSGAIAGPTSGFPGQGSNWCIVNSNGAAGGLASPAGGPAPSLNAGLTGNVRVLMQVPVPAPGMLVRIEFDWNYVSPECQNDSQYNDHCSIDLVQGSASVLNMVYRDTFSAQLGAPAVTPDESGSVPVGFCNPPGTLEENTIGARKSSMTLVPAGLHGQMVQFSVNVGNGFDAAFSSYAWIDNVRFTGGVAPPDPLNFFWTNNGGGLWTLRVTSQVTPVAELFNLVSLTPAVPTGSGPLLGLSATPEVFTQFGYPLGTHPFHVSMTGGSYTFGPFAIPTGISIDYASIAIAGGAVAEIDPAETITF